jgi:hypothetical protein
MKKSIQLLYQLGLASGILITMVLGIFTTLWAAAEPIGKVTDITGTARAITSAGAESKLVLESPVYLMDRIVTEKDSRIGIVFKDNTYLAVGPESDMTMDTYVYSPEGRNNVFNLKALKGIFMLIGGKIARKSDRFKVTMPVAVIGVRGTSVGIMYQVSKPLVKKFNATRKKRRDLKLNPKYLYAVNFAGQSYAANQAGKVEMKAPGHFSIVKPAKKATIPYLAMAEAQPLIVSDAPTIRYTASQAQPIRLAAAVGGPPSLGSGAGPAGQMADMFSDVFSGMSGPQGGFSDALVDQMQPNDPNNPSSDQAPTQPTPEGSDAHGASINDVDAGSDGGDGGGH